VAESFVTSFGGTVGLYVEQEETLNEADRGYYQSVADPSWCIWWHKRYRHWWMGHCSSRGQNNGNVYLGPDKLCPSDGLNGEWKSGGLDEVAKGYVRVATEADLKPKENTEGVALKAAKNRGFAKSPLFSGFFQPE